MSDATQTSFRKYSARVFARGGMPCPHCQKKMREPAEACPHCGFDLVYCEEAFPFAAPPLALLIDPSQLLPERLGDEIEGAYRKFRKRFPQIDFSFCFVRLQPKVEIREFSFWLHNKAPGADEQRAWQLLIVTDVTTGRVALTPGYALEPFIRSEPWEAALQELAACISEEHWKEGLTGFLREAADILTRARAHAEKRERDCDTRREPES